MRQTIFILYLLVASIAFADVKFTADKQAAIATIDKTSAEMTALSLSISRLRRIRIGLSKPERAR